MGSNPTVSTSIPPLAALQHYIMYKHNSGCGIIANPSLLQGAVTKTDLKNLQATLTSELSLNPTLESPCFKRPLAQGVAKTKDKQSPPSVSNDMERYTLKDLLKDVELVLTPLPTPIKLKNGDVVTDNFDQLARQDSNIVSLTFSEAAPQNVSILSPTSPVKSQE